VSRRTTSPYQVSLLENNEENLKAEAGPVVGCLYFAAGIVVEILFSFLQGYLIKQGIASSAEPSSQ